MQQPDYNYSYSGFPVSLIQLLRCASCGNEIHSTIGSSDKNNFILNGYLLCRTCGEKYQITHGIVCMLKPQDLDRESLHEQKLWDEKIGKDPDFPMIPSWEYLNKLEMKPTLTALGHYDGCTMLELACGTGRYTTVFATKCSSVVAVDFSIASLLSLSRKIPPGSSVGLIQADITRLAVAPRSFDRVFSTTSLDSREQRMTMNRLAADALSDHGRFVFSAEHYELPRRLLGMPRARRYTPGGIYLCHLEKDQIVRETAPFFSKVRVRPINFVLPLQSHLGQRLGLVIARVVERVPVVRGFGRLLLACCLAPIRPPSEGEALGGNGLLKALYLKYKRFRGREKNGKIGISCINEMLDRFWVTIHKKICPGMVL